MMTEFARAASADGRAWAAGSEWDLVAPAFRIFPPEGFLAEKPALIRPCGSAEPTQGGTRPEPASLSWLETSSQQRVCHELQEKRPSFTARAARCAERPYGLGRDWHDRGSKLCTGMGAAARLAWCPASRSEAHHSHSRVAIHTWLPSVRSRNSCLAAVLGGISSSGQWRS